MEKDFKEAMDKSKIAMKSLEGKIEDLAEDFNENASEIWSDLKKTFEKMGTKLDGASTDISREGDEATLQAHLAAMEARENMEKVKDSVEEFTEKVMESAQVGLDTAVLKANLAKMEAEDFWDKNGKNITKEFETSKENVGKLAVEAIDEITNFFEKLSTKLSKEKV